MSAVRGELLIQLIKIGTTQVVEERESECVGGTGQGLLKRVGAALKNLEILEQPKPRKEGTEQVYKQQRAMGKEEIRRITISWTACHQERTRSRRRWCLCPGLPAHQAPSQSGVKDKKGFKPKPKAALVHRIRRCPTIAGTSQGIFSDTPYTCSHWGRA